MSKAVLLVGFWLAASVASVALAHKHEPVQRGGQAALQVHAALQAGRHQL